MPRNTVLSIPYTDRPRQFDTQIINIGVSTSALFDTRDSDKVFREQGEKPYMKYMAEHEDEPFEPGAAFAFVKKMLLLNRSNRVLVNGCILSRNNPFVARRVDASIKAHGMTFEDNGLRQFYGESYTGGGPITPTIIQAYNIDIFLSTRPDDVKTALSAGCAAGVVPAFPCSPYQPLNNNLIRIVLDFDRTIAIAYGETKDEEAGLDSECVFAEKGMSAYEFHEEKFAKLPAKPGPLAPLFAKIHNLRNELIQNESGAQVELSVMTARTAGCVRRTITTLQAWGIEPNALFSCGATLKAELLKDQKADIFFDDSERHLKGIPSGTLGVHVPWIEKGPPRPPVPSIRDAQKIREGAKNAC